MIDSCIYVSLQLASRVIPLRLLQALYRPTMKYNTSSTLISTERFFLPMTNTPIISSHNLFTRCEIRWINGQRPGTVMMHDWQDRRLNQRKSVTHNTRSLPYLCLIPQPDIFPPIAVTSHFRSGGLNVNSRESKQRYCSQHYRSLPSS